jgi:hypothetical protein
MGDRPDARQNRLLEQVVYVPVQTLGSGGVPGQTCLQAAWAQGAPSIGIPPPRKLDISQAADTDLDWVGQCRQQEVRAFGPEVLIWHAYLLQVGPGIGLLLWRKARARLQVRQRLETFRPHSGLHIQCSTSV